MSEDPPILARLNDDREVPCHTVNCGQCRNEWFVPGYSEEWMPSYCCYCGIKFVRHEQDGSSAPYRPAQFEDPDHA